MVIPDSYLIKRGEEKAITINFTPKAIRKYDMVLVVNIAGVGDDMLSLPIRAESRAPRVKIEPDDQLDFGKVYLQYPYTQSIILFNESDLWAMYNIAD